MINFNFGKKKPDKKQLLIVGVVLSTLIAALSQCTKIPDHALWNLLDEVQRKYFPNGILNELILQDPHAVERRVKRDVDRALDEAIPEYDRIIQESNKRYKPRYVEKPPNGSEAQRLLGGEMRICASWIDNCEKNDL